MNEKIELRASEGGYITLLYNGYKRKDFFMKREKVMEKSVVKSGK